jgi:hypothetical protein
MADNKPLEWAISVIAAAPPMQNVIAFLIVLCLAAPLIRAGWREFKNREKKPEALPAPAPAPELIQQTPWLIETLTRIQLEIEQLGRDVAKVSSQVDVVDKIMRRRAAQKPRK